MRLRTRFLLLVGLLLSASVTAVTWLVASRAERTFVTLDEQRTAAAVSQFQREFVRAGQLVSASVGRIAATDTVRRLLLDLTRPAPDARSTVDVAAALAAEHDLEILDLVLDDGSIVSSAAWRGRFGYRHPWAATAGVDRTTAFLQIDELPSGTTVALMALRVVQVGSHSLFIAGGRSVQRELLAGLDLPPGTRAFIYRDLTPGFEAGQLVAAGDPPSDMRAVEALVMRVRTSRRPESETVDRSGDAETLHATPLTARDGRVAGALIVMSSRRELALLVRDIRRTGLLVGTVAVLAGLLLTVLIAARVTRPLENLAGGARRVAAGDWDTSIDVGGGGEVAELTTTFNGMTRRLAEQRDRIQQVERVAAWRELARRLAHELKNPLFPLRITLDNLQRARGLPPDEFREVFDESTTTLASGLTNLTTVVGRFSDFAKMPKPEVQPTGLNALVGRTLKLYEAQLSAGDRPAIATQLDLDERAGVVPIDPELIGRALQNLVLNAIDAMPDGGRLTVRTRRGSGVVRLEVSDTGAGMTEEERTRLFTPYYTSKPHGTGLGLAIVQSVVADHRGRVWVESEQGRGSTFIIELPVEL